MARCVIGVDDVFDKDIGDDAAADACVEQAAFDFDVLADFAGVTERREGDIGVGAINAAVNDGNADAFARIRNAAVAPGERRVGLQALQADQGPRLVGVVMILRVGPHRADV